MFSYQLTLLFFAVTYSGAGLGQVQIKLGDFKSSLSSFEKVLEVYPENCESLKVRKIEQAYFVFEI